MSKPVTADTPPCEVGFHPKLTSIASDGFNCWKCDVCGEIVDELEIINKACEKTCDLLLDQATNRRGSFGSAKMNKIVELIRKGMGNDSAE